MKANEVRRAFTEFFVERAHSHQPSSSLIPHDPTLLFTVAGMVPFKTYFTGEEAAPFPRAVTIQKCVRAGGKHNDLDEIGRTRRHLTFFEMMGNFSFGDYFKGEAIHWAWEFLTDKKWLGLNPEQLSATVYHDDDEAAGIWLDEIKMPAGRLQRLDEDASRDSGPETAAFLQVLATTVESQSGFLRGPTTSPSRRKPKRPKRACRPVRTPLMGWRMASVSSDVPNSTAGIQKSGRRSPCTVIVRPVYHCEDALS